MPRVLLMNPNSNLATTASMVAIAQRILPSVEGWTAPSGPGLLTAGPVMAVAGQMVAQAQIPAGIAGIIVSAFGDPGRAALAARLSIPVVGIGAAAAQEAAQGGRPFAVVTHTPDLVPDIDALMRASAPGGRYLGVFLTHGTPDRLAADPPALDAALLDAMRRAIRAGAEAVIIGGGPLGEAADRLHALCPCVLIAPIPTAARAVLSLLK